MRLVVVVATAVVLGSNSKKNTVARCGPPAPSALARTLGLIEIAVLTPSSDNVCEGLRTDWRDGLGQCLGQLSGVRVLARNSDGSCADCGTLQKTACVSEDDAVADVTVALGGAKKSSFECCEHSFGEDKDGIPPSDFEGTCRLRVRDDQGRAVRMGRRIAFFPILNPTFAIRVLWEKSELYVDENKVTVVRDDAFPKPLLLPPKERILFERRSGKRDSTLLYAGQFRDFKGQLAFLNQISPETLGPYVLEFIGSRTPDDDFDDIKRAAVRFGGRVLISETRISHLRLMRKMATASGLVHYSNHDRNPRVLYEALYFGLPIFVTRESMPYVALQCQPFATVVDFGDLSSFPKWRDSLNQSSFGAFVDNHLTPDRVYLKICATLGLCDYSLAVDSLSCPNYDRFENWRRASWNATKQAKNLPSACRRPSSSSSSSSSVYDDENSSALLVL